MSTAAASAPTRVPSERAVPAVEITGLSKKFHRANGTTITPVDDISLTVERGEILVLLGPSGCGKTTLLRCVAGLETPNSGTIKIHGRTYFDSTRRIAEPPERRRLGMIFQSYALWPHMTVRDNVAYPLKAAKVPRKEISERVEKALTTVGIPEVIDQIPGRLSGGQQQRVALARALVAEPDLILFDEPLSNVDAKVRTELRIELLEMQRRLGFTALYVTHDQVEAMELADRIAVLRDGRIDQLADARTVYSRPSTRHVAHFVGAANELIGVVVRSADGVVRVAVDGSEVDVATDRQWTEGTQVGVMWRPEVTRIVETSSEDSAGLVVQVEVVAPRFLGAYTDYFCRSADGTDVRVASAHALAITEGQSIRLAVAASDLTVFDAADPR